MKNNGKKIRKSVPSLLKTEGARRATGVFNNSPARAYAPDPEVSVKATRRRFTARYKLGILQKAENCTNPGQIGTLLRKEGLYSSNLTTWRLQKERGTLEALSPKHRGPKKRKSDFATRYIAKLERENHALSQKLKQAETIIEVQKKIQKCWMSTPTKQEKRYDVCN